MGYTDKLVSVIVPVYNVKPYLRDCMTSLLEQTWPWLEILLIDDGSSDGSGELCDTFAEDDRVRVFHQTNQGVSAARNVGLDAAAGEYIAFADPDDTCLPQMMEQMVCALEESEADIVSCSYLRCTPSGEFSGKPQPGCLTGVDGFVNLLRERWYTTAVWNKMIRHTVLKNDFPVGRTVGEDEIFLRELLCGQDCRIGFLPDALYRWNFREGSALNAGRMKWTVQNEDMLKTRLETLERMKQLKSRDGIRLAKAELGMHALMLAQKAHSIGQEQKALQCLQMYFGVYPQWLLTRKHFLRAIKTSVKAIQLYINVLGRMK